MPSPINKKILKHLAALVRFELTEREEEKLRKDIQHIIAHFDELRAVPIEGVPPTTGGTDAMGVFRDDAARENTDHREGIDDFPATENGYLKVPPIFGKE